MTYYFYVPNGTNFVVRSELANNTPEIPDLPTYTEFSVDDHGEIEVIVIPPLEASLKQLKLIASVIEMEPLGHDTAKVNQVSVTYKGKQVTLDVPTQKVICIPDTVEVFSIFKLFACFVLTIVLAFVSVLLGLPATADAITIISVIGMLLWMTIIGLTVKKRVYGTNKM